MNLLKTFQYNSIRIKTTKRSKALSRSRKEGFKTTSKKSCWKKAAEDYDIKLRRRRDGSKDKAKDYKRSSSPETQLNLEATLKEFHP